MPEHTLDREARFVAVSLCLAMMTAASPQLTGADGNTVVEGPFAGNRLYVEMLVAATGRSVEAMTGAVGSTIGAALLARMEKPEGRRTLRAPIQGSPVMSRYAAVWRAAVAK